MSNNRLDSLAGAWTGAATYLTSASRLQSIDLANNSIQVGPVFHAQWCHASHTNATFCVHASVQFYFVAEQLQTAIISSSGECQW